MQKPNRKLLCLTGYNLLDPVGKFFPLLLADVEVRSQVQYRALPGSTLGPDRLDQLKSEVALPVFVVGVCGFADEHGGWIAC